MIYLDIIQLIVKVIFFVFDIKAVSEAESPPPNELRNFVFEDKL